jgi:hypothetical protein
MSCPDFKRNFWAGGLTSQNKKTKEGKGYE